VPNLTPGELTVITDAVGEAWGENVRRIVRGNDALNPLVDHAFTAMQQAGDTIERRWLNRNEDDIVTDTDRPSKYYNSPIWSVVKPEGAVLQSALQSPHMQSLIEYATGSEIPAEPLFIPSTRDDLERLGTEMERRAKLFWAAVHAIHESQQGWSVEARFRAMMADAPAAEQPELEKLRRYCGTEIHGLVARDSNSRWAYYHVHVEREREEEFLKSLDSTGTIDLEDYGKVVLSTYESTFRARQTEIAKAKLQHIAERIRVLDVQERSFSYPSRQREAALGRFDARRLERALADPGSAEALHDEIARITVDRGSIDAANADTPAAQPPLLYEHKLTAGVAEQFVTMVRERKLALPDIAFVARLLTDPTPEVMAAFLEPLRVLAQQVGTGADQFSRFLLFVCQHRGLTNPDMMSAALVLASERQKPSWWRADVIQGFLPVVGMALASPLVAVAGGLAALASAKQRSRPTKLDWIGLDWVTVQRSLAACDLLLRCEQELSLAFSKQLHRFVSLPDHAGSLSEVHASVRAIAERVSIKKTQVITGIDAIDAAGLRVEANAVRRLLGLKLHVRDEDISKILKEIVNSNIINDICSLSVFWGFISDKPDSVQRELLREIISASLQDAFDKAEADARLRENVTDLVTDALLTPARNAAPPLPVEAPVKWKDRNPGETPPDFVRRVYGRWAVDGDGIGKRVLRTLDPTLVNELNSWVRDGNEVPADIKLLTIKEENDKLLNDGPAAMQEHLGKFTAEEAVREITRLRSAQQRRGKFK